MWKTILCPTDFSEPARDALRMAAKLAIDSDAQLILQHVGTPPSYFVGEPVMLSASMVSDIMAGMRKALDAWKIDAIKLGVTKVSTELVIGGPGYEIVELAKKKGADLIVIGTHGHTGLKHVLLGSVTEKVVRHAPCPVLVIRHPS